MHGGPVTRVVVSPDRRRVATAGEARRATVSDADTGERLYALPYRDVIDFQFGGFTRDGREVLRIGRDAASGLPWLRVRGPTTGKFFHSPLTKAD